jgi:hypothetical protein
MSSDPQNLESIDKMRQNRTSEKQQKYNNVNKNVVVPFHQDLINFNNMKQINPIDLKIGKAISF